MSTPKSMQLTANQQQFQITTERGEFAALQALPNQDPIGTALLVHGFTGSKEDFIHLLPELAKVGWRAIAIDQRGCNETYGSENEADYDLEVFAKDLVSILASFDQPVHLLGHSFGGLVTAAAAISGGKMASLTLFCSGPGAIPGTSYDWLHEFITDLESGNKADRIEKSVAEMKANNQLSNPAVEQFLRTRWSNTSTAALIAKAKILINQPDLSIEVAKLAAAGLPVLVTHGVADDAWPIELQKQMAETIKAQYIVIQDSAHSPNVENVPATTMVLDQFWRSLL